jgi:glycosyltransferase involved in cell wall biosynthesis
VAKAHLVSVVIPTYNYAHFIGEAIDSAFSQSYRDFEIVVVDDGSTDNTKEFVSRFPDVRYLYQTNKGIAAARNAGLLNSRGDYLVFLDADDRLLPNCLEAGVNSLEDNPACAFVSGQWQRIAEDGKALPPVPGVVVKEDHYRAFLDYNYVGTVGQVMFRRRVLEAVKGFDSSAPGCDDIELYLRIARDYPVHCHDQVVVQYRVHGSNTSRNRAMMLTSMLQVYRAQLQFVRGKAELESLCEQGIKLCEKFLVKERKRERRERYRSQWLVKHALNIRQRLKAELVFQRYKLMRRRSQQ